MKEYDATGGLATTNEDLRIIPDNAKKYLHGNSDVENYTVEILDEKVPVKKYVMPSRKNGWRSSSYEIGSKCKLAKLILTMYDGEVKEYYYAYYEYGQRCQGVEVVSYKPTSISSDLYKHAGPTTVVHQLKSLLEKTN